MNETAGITTKDAASPQSELQQAKAELAALEAARAKREEARELDGLRVRISNERAVAKAEEEYGPLRVKIMTVEHETGVAIVKQSNPLIYRRFQETGKTTQPELEKLVFPCLVHPTREAFEAELVDQPGLLLRCANAVAYLAGSRAEDIQKK